MHEDWRMWAFGALICVGTFPAARGIVQGVARLIWAQLATRLGRSYWTVAAASSLAVGVGFSWLLGIGLFAGSVIISFICSLISEMGCGARWTGK